MRAFIPFLYIVLFTVISCEKETQTCCSCLESQGKTDKYIFPIQPGMEEWAKLESHQAMVDVCQVPENILKDMCTIGLVDTYLDYPILFTIFAFNNVNEGLYQVSNEFNGFQELLYRNDCATIFLLRYESINPADIDTSMNLIEQGEFMKQFKYMEVTLAFEPLNQKFSTEERKKIINLGFENLRLKEENNYGGPSLITNTYLIGKMLEKEEYKPFLDFIERRNDLKLFLSGYLNYLRYVADGDTIKNYALSYLNQN